MRPPRRQVPVTIAVLGSGGLLTLGATPASAATASKQVFGGATRPDQNPIVLTVRGRRVVRLSTFHRSPCGPWTRTWRPNASISAGGRFTIEFEGVGTGPDGEMAFWEERVVGRIRGGSATGIASVSMRARNAEGEEYVAAVRWTARHQPGRVFSGATSQGLGVVVALSADREVIDTMHVAYTASCRTGGRITIGELFRDFTVTRGRLGEDRRYTIDLGDGTEVVLVVRVAGRIARGRTASGTLRITVTYERADDSIEDVCTTPDIRWTAES